MKNNNLPNHDLSFLLKALENQNFEIQSQPPKFLMKNIPIRSPLELENDKKIFQNSEKDLKNNIILELSTYNNLSEQTRHELSKYTQFRGNYVKIYKNSLFV